ncbi:MAG TPA: BrnT family toxin [Steroidobacteraceae bacterium]|nr:BrnT family toxin [Steroidobacteraceae bacterium]
MNKTLFEWDEKKDAENRRKHGIDFSLAQYAFADPHRVIAEDALHSKDEQRYFCFGDIDGHVVTVRFTYRSGVIRIIGAGY